MEDIKDLVFHPGHFKKDAPIRRMLREKMLKNKREMLLKRKNTLILKTKPIPYRVSFVPSKNTILWIPCGYNVPVSVKSIFNVISKFGMYKMESRIQYNIKSILEAYNNIIRVEGSKNSPFLKNLRAAYKKDSQEWKNVLILYKNILQNICIIKRFIRSWRLKRILANRKNTEDIVTLDVPVCPVYIIDYVNRTSFVYEAVTIRRAIEERLYYSNYMFPEAQTPLNPLTNMPITFSQILSIHEQCKRYGEFSWCLDRLIAVSYDIDLFEKVYKISLHLHAINYHFAYEKDESYQLVVEYFLMNADEEDMCLRKSTRFARMIRYEPDNILVKKWTNATRDSYIASQLSDPERILESIRVTNILLKNVEDTM